MSRNPVIRNTGPAKAKDVARIVGVSQSTVSRVLNGSAGNLISEETKRRVIEIASQIGYTPNPFAQALRGKKLHLLGLVVREINDPFFSKLIAELSTQARRMNFNLVLGHAHSDPDEALKITTTFNMRHMDGVLVLGDLKNDQMALDEIVRGKQAVVALCRGSSPTTLNTVNSDNNYGTRILLDHLIQFGHKKIGFIDGGWLGDIRERRETFINYMSERDYHIRPEWVLTETNGAEGGYRAMQALLDLQDSPTAVFASDDTMAIGALKAVFDRGLRVPNDMSIVGYDDIEMAQYICPPLTTIHQPIEEICTQALKIMLNIIDQGELPDSEKVVRILPNLVIRQSTGPIHA
jgi:DNA-binding LacI/PurR family transcriptional regulator